MSKEYIILTFNTMLFMLPNTEQERMLKWCQSRGMEWFETKYDFCINVVFRRDKNAYDFIKEFLEPKVEHALSFDSLSKIPGITVR